MTSSIDVDLEALADDFDVLGDWEERIGYTIDLGKALPPLSMEERTDANRVRGCAAATWLVGSKSVDGKLIFRGDSEAFITKGLVAILLRLLSGRQAKEILEFDINAAMARLGFDKALTKQRSNGLASMVEMIYHDAKLA